MNDRQLELSLPKLASCRRGRRGGPGQTRARWWFDRMRQIIELAPEAAELPGPERGAESPQHPATDISRQHAAT